MSSEIREFAEQVIGAEVNALRGLIPALDDHFDRAVRLVLDCPGAVLTSGIGKAGHVARKLSASFSSTGTPSHFLNPAEAMHGDLGSVRKGDVVIVLSYSGESDEILRMLSVLKKLGHPVIAMTSHAGNALGRHADVVLKLGQGRGSLPARPGAERVDDRDDGPRRRAVPRRHEVAEVHGRGIRPVPPGRAARAEAHPGEGGDDVPGGRKPADRVATN